MTQADRIRERTRQWLEARGVDLSQTQEILEARRQATRSFSNPLPEGRSSTIRFIPLGFEEFRSVGNNGAKAPRCMARSKSSGGGQCGRVATRGYRVCRLHGAGSTGSKTAEGKARQGEHYYTGAGESRAERRARSQASKERRALRRIMKEIGQ